MLHIVSMVYYYVMLRTAIELLEQGGLDVLLG